jgi:hypothetical protein
MLAMWKISVCDVSRERKLPIVPKRLVATWFDASREEQQAIFDLVDEVKRQLDAVLSPDGYNVGFNAGDAAGQTVWLRCSSLQGGHPSCVRTPCQPTCGRRRLEDHDNWAPL